MADRLTRELRRLARLFRAASASFDVLAEELQAEPLAPRDADTIRSVASQAEAMLKAANVPDDGREELPWDVLVQRAIELLRAAPDRIWKPAELTRAVRDSGVPLGSLQGVHFGLMPRLRDLGAVEDVDGGFRSTHARTIGESDGDVAGSNASSAAPREEPPWDAIVERAITLLRAEPSRVWRPAELARAVRDSGVSLSSLQGVHLGLMPRLRDAGAVTDVDGGFTATAAQSAPDVAPASSARIPEGEPMAPPMEDAAAAASPAPASSNAPAPSAAVAPEPAPSPPAAPPEPAKREQPWAEILAAAMQLLRADPDRRWGQAELSRAVRAKGVQIDNLQGVHIGLTSRLTSLGLAELDAAGTLRLSPLVGGRDEEPSSAALSAPESDEPADSAAALADEIDACELFLEGMRPERRTAQVAVWAGKARDLQELWASDVQVTAERRSALRRVFGRLTRITREHRCGWVDALTPEWVTNWTAYVEFYEAATAGEAPALNEDELQSFWRGKLRGLLLPTRRHVSSFDAAEVISNATAVLPEDDDDLLAAVERFGPARHAKPPIVRKAASNAQPAAAAPQPVAPRAPEPSHFIIPEAIRTATSGKRVLIVGGQGAREEHRRTLQSTFGFSELDWVFSERGAASHYARLEERVKHGSYDLVFFLAGYTSHKAVPFLKQCKASGVPLVYLSRGYGVAQVGRALAEQWMPKAAATDTAAR